MSRFHRPFVAVAAAFVLCSCGSAPPPPPPPPATRDLAALDTVTSGIMGMPVTTASADARSHFLQGQRELDLARNFEALDHFKLAVAADSTFAIAYLNIATTGNSLDEFKTNLARAEALAAKASDAEQLQIEIARRGLENDASGQLTTAQQLVAKYPDSPRAYLTRGNERGFFAPFRAYVSVYAGNAKNGISELNQLVAQADGMGIPDPVTVKINALSNVALIAIDTRDFPSADAALKQRTPLMMRQAD